MVQEQNLPHRTAHIVSHTHWDREWRFDVWGNRMLLQDLMEEIIEALETNLYPGFLMDGQVAPIVDYLEIAPHMEPRLRQLIAEGKLEIGPWYTAPDEFPVDGECLVRNLLLGRRISRDFGKALMVGYTPFGWGQIAQLPQIYTGFGIKLAMIGKKVNDQRAPRSEFLWRSPDGTELLTSRFGAWGRQNFYLCFHLSVLFGIDHVGPAWRYDWAHGGIVYHRADAAEMADDYENLDPPQTWHPEMVTPELIEKLWATTDASVLANDRLMMDGCDHYSGIQPLLGEMIHQLNEVDPDPQRQWVHTTLGHFAEILTGRIDKSQLVTVNGELRDGPAPAVTGNALTNRLYLKQKNKHAQNLLIRFAEPWAALAAFVGSRYPLAFLQKAWDYLLKAQPHDSINGVGRDKMADDVEYRLNQVIEISQRLGNRSLAAILRQIDLSGFGPDDVLLVVFNSLPYARSETLEAWIDVPGRPSLDDNWLPPPQGLLVTDSQGREYPTQWQGEQFHVLPVLELHTRGFPFECRKHRLFFHTGRIPACGYKVFRIGSPQERRQRDVKYSDKTSRTDTLLKKPHVMENEFFIVTMNGNGTFNLRDKILDTEYQQVNYFEDRGEHGDFWVNRRPRHDQIHNSLGCTARIWAEDSGPLSATLVSEIAMELPQKGIKEQQRRGDALVPLVIQTRITLKTAQNYVDVTVDLENRHEDHYLRVMIPSNVPDAVTAAAGGQFHVDTRPIQPQGPDESTVWPDMATLPHNNFIDVSDGISGLAILNDSLMEYEVLDNDERTIALSLIRSVANCYCRELRVNLELPSEKGGQSLGRHHYHYAIMPHKGNWQAANVPLQAECFNVPLRPVQTNRHPGKLHGSRFSFFAIENPHLRFSAFKPAQDRAAYILRIYNPCPDEQAGQLNFAVPVAEAWRTNLNEERLGPLEIKNQTSMAIAVKPFKIETIEIRVSDSASWMDRIDPCL